MSRKHHTETAGPVVPLAPRPGHVFCRASLTKKAADWDSSAPAGAWCSTEWRWPVSDHPEGALRRVFHGPRDTGRVVRVVGAVLNDRGDRVAVRNVVTDRLSYVQARDLRPMPEPNTP